MAKLISAFVLGLAITAQADLFSGAEWIGFNPKPQRRAVESGPESRLNWEAMRWFWTGETDSQGKLLPATAQCSCVSRAP